MGGAYKSDPYAGGGGAYSHDPYGGSSSKQSAAPKKGKHSLVGQFFTDIKDAAVHAPGGVVAAGKASVDDVLHGRSPVVNPVGYFHDSRFFNEVVKPSAVQTAHDARHPLRHPGYTALDLSAVLNPAVGSVGRVGTFARAAAAGEDVSAASRVAAGARAAAKRPLPKPRLVSHDGVTVKIPASAAPVNRLLQHGLDRLREAFPDVPLFGAAHVVGKETARSVRYAAQVNRAEIDALARHARAAGLLRRAKNGRLAEDALARQHALRVVAEGVPTQERVAFHQHQLAEGFKASARKNPQIRQLRERDFTQGHQEQIRLNGAAQDYVDESSGVPRLTDPKLQAAYDQMVKVTGSREALLERLDNLSAASKANRLSAAGRVLKGATFDKEHGLVGAEGFAGGEARIPTVPGYKTPRSKRVPPGVGANGGVAAVKTPPSLRHPYTGAAYRAGKIRNDVVHLVTESALEAQRFWTLLHVTDRLREVAKDAPTSRHDVPIVVEKLPDQPSIREVQARMDEAHGRNVGYLSHAYEGLRDRLFPAFDPETRLAYEPLPGIKYVDERLLGGLNRPNPLIGFFSHPFLKGALRVTDGLNNASRLAILYLKPAYAVPNLLGNLALNLVQQGFAAPARLREAARLNAAVGRDVAAKVDAAMGEGIGGSLEAHAGKTVHVAAEKWSKVVDLVPRRAAFLHEAIRDGVKTPEQLKALFDPANADKLDQIQRRANAAIIDYANLNPVEQAIVRRVIFFYPWVKGASLWAVHFVTEHPFQAGVTEHLGQIGQQQQQQQLGSLLPDWAQTLVAVGTGPHGLPETVNPAGISVLQTPADIAQAVAHPSESINAAGNLTPAVAAAFAALSPDRRYQLTRMGVDIPLVTAVLQATGHKPSKTFPYEQNAKAAALRFLLGTGLVPRETSVDELRAGYIKQQHP